MKKVSLFFAWVMILAFCVGFTSCEKNDDATVSITVKKFGIPQSNVTVYMFDEPATSNFGSKPIFADKSSVTNDNGVAVFGLQNVIDLDPINNQTTLYFTVFAMDNTTILGTVGVTLRKGDNIQKVLTIN